MERQSKFNKNRNRSNKDSNKNNNKNNKDSNKNNNINFKNYKDRDNKDRNNKNRYSKDRDNKDRSNKDRDNKNRYNKDRSKNKSGKIDKKRNDRWNEKINEIIPIKFPNTYIKIKRKGVDLFTKNLVSGQTFFGESLIKKKINNENIELRQWDYTRSKLGAAIFLKVSQLGINKGDKVLYLGASHGFTPSYVSDIVGEKGFVFCLDFAPRVIRDLYLLCQKRHNMAPIIADANKPEDYEELIPKVDVIFMDIAQREQVKIFLKNFKFLKKEGFAILALKARSVDVTRKPKYVFRDAREELEKHTMIVDYKELDPVEKDHCIFVCKNK